MDFEQILKNNEFVGIVEDNIDPERKQRIKIRIPYLHGTKEQIPTDHLPWSHCGSKSNNGSTFVVPQINKIMNVSFPTGELLYPVYKSAEHLNINLQKKIEELSDSEYTDFSSLLYNHNTQIFIQADLHLYHNKSGLQVTEDGDVVARLNGNRSNFFVGDKEASQAMILGNHFFDWFDTLIDTLFDPYIGNSGAPLVVNPNMTNVLIKYKAMKKKFLSDNAFISDNGSVSDNDIETEVAVGDSYEMIKADPQLQVEIEEFKKEEIQKQAAKELSKEQIEAEKIDEKVNEEDGLLNSANKNDYTRIVEELKSTSTEFEPIEEYTNEGNDSPSNESDGGYFDYFTDDESDFTADNSTDEEFWSEEYYDSQSVPPLSGGTDGAPISGTESGRTSRPKYVNTKKEILDLSYLPSPGMISKIVSYDKAIYSGTAKQYNLPNDPDNNDHLKNLVTVFSLYFDPTYKFFKDNFGYILVLNSAYRSTEVNSKVGGSASSQHKLGSALDIILTKNGNSNERLNNLLFYYLKHKFNHFGQLIWESNWGDGPKWCHISLNNRGKTRQILQLVGGQIKEPNSETLRILKEYGIWDDSKEKKQYV